MVDYIGNLTSQSNEFNRDEVNDLVSNLQRRFRDSKIDVSVRRWGQIIKTLKVAALTGNIFNEISLAECLLIPYLSANRKELIPTCIDICIELITEITANWNYMKKCRLSYQIMKQIWLPEKLIAEVLLKTKLGENVSFYHSINNVIGDPIFRVYSDDQVISTSDYFQFNGGRTSRVFSPYKYQIDRRKCYSFKVNVKISSKQFIYVGIVCYDIKGKHISPWRMKSFITPNTTCRILGWDDKLCAIKVHKDDINLLSNYKQPPTQTHYRTLGIDVQGDSPTLLLEDHILKIQGDSANTDTENSAYREMDLVNGLIYLNPHAWQSFNVHVKDEIKEGISTVCNTFSGGTYVYPVAKAIIDNFDEWNVYDLPVFGDLAPAPEPSIKLRPETNSVSFVVLSNYDKQNATCPILFKDFTWSET